jgi:hypothetical protein
MKYVVEVAHLVTGDLVSVKHLSRKRERAAGVAAALAVAGAGTALMVGAGLLVLATGRAIFVPPFIAVWALATAAVAAIAVRAVRHRLSRYVVGSSLGADAFAVNDVELVRRRGDAFELTVVPGMNGQVESGRAPIPVEALVSDSSRTLVLEPGARAELSIGQSTFVVRSRFDAPARVDEARGGFGRDMFKLFSPMAALGLQLALLGTVWSAVQTGQAIGDRPAHLVSPRITTPWEAEKWLRIEAQAQAKSLHQCFDPLPLTCQHSGYVGVGVALSREGEVRSNWIARSTYGKDCPVEECVKGVVATWVFDPLPEAMRVILPVQVLRTSKPLPMPMKVAEASLKDEPASLVPRYERQAVGTRE